MDNQEYLGKYKKIQSKILELIDSDEFDVKLFIDEKIRNNKHDLALLFHLISKIGSDHHRNPSFFEKMDKIIKFFEEDLKQFFSKYEIFSIFKDNKRLLLFLIEEKILNIDEYFVRRITTSKYAVEKYPQYFSPEIKPFINEKWFPKYRDNFLNLIENDWFEKIKEELPDCFYEKRKAGENDNLICNLIRNDSIDEFIIYITKNNFPLESKIDPSIYETNSYLVNHNPKLIEYAAFYGSIQIFNYLRSNNVVLSNSLWIYAIHGNNTEIIQFLEDNLDEPDEESYQECFFESIKCHHNEISDYFLNNFLNNEQLKSHDTFTQIIKYYNFKFISTDLIDLSSFCEICKYDYYQLANFLMSNNDVKEIKIMIFNYI